MPPIIPVSHDPNSKNQQNKTKALKLLFHANVFKAFACWKHSDFLKVTTLEITPHSQVQKCHPRTCLRHTNTYPVGRPVVPSRNPTTSFLTATTLIYAIGAGITAAAGTRLALQWVLAKIFLFSPFQLQDMDALYCYFLSLPPCVKIG